MTERRGRRARWTTALIVAPGAAALFGASVDWAVNTKPATAAAPAQQARPPATDPSTQAIAAAQRLYRGVLAQQRTTAVLSKDLAGLNSKIARMLAAEHAAATTSGGTRGASGGGASTTSTGTSNTPAAAWQPPPAAQPAPVVIAAPPVQAVTGASGVPK